jgi:hypothetical protein
MTPKDALHRTVMDYPGGAEALACRLGMNAQVLRNKINPNSTSHHPSLHDVEQIMHMTGNAAVLHSLAKGMGYTCTEIMAEGEANDMAVLEHISKIWKTNGLVGTEVHSALEDSRISPHELVRIKDAVHRTTTALHDLIKRLEGMSENV